MKKWGLILIILIVPFFFFGCEKQNLKKLETPTELNVSAGGIVSFRRVKDDEYYSIFIDDNEFVINKNNPRVQLYNFEGADYFEYNSCKLLPLTLGRAYEFAVQAHANGKKSSDISAKITYVHNLKLDSPQEAKISNNTLTWQPVELADGYVVRVQFGNSQTDFNVGENSFNISPVLLEAGKYNFSVCAVSNNANYENSNFCDAVGFSNILQLSVPNLSQVYFNEGQAFVKVAVDANANSLVANLNSTKFELPLIENEILKRQEGLQNFWEINLSLLSEAYAEQSNVVSLSLAANFSSTGSEIYFSSSPFSNVVVAEKTEKLTAPQIELTEQEGKYLLSWDNFELDNLSGYKVFVAMADEVKTYTFDCNTNSILLEDFVAVAVQKLGKGNFLSSNLSAFKSTAEQEIDNFEITQDGSTLNLTEIEGIADYYLVEIGGELKQIEQNIFDILPYIDCDAANVTAIASGKAAKTVSHTLQPIKLNSPQNLKFSSLKAYQLTFDAVENAMGYYVYVAGKTEDNQNFVKLNQVFCSNQIDLSKFLTSVEEYDVCVQAIAGQNGYADSDLSATANVKRTQKLERPIVLLTNPLTKEGNKYYLNFVGVAGAKEYEIVVNYSQKITVDASDQLNLHADITKFVSTSGDYFIRLRAIPDESNPLWLASDYFEYTLKIEV